MGEHLLNRVIPSWKSDCVWKVEERCQEGLKLSSRLGAISGLGSFLGSAGAPGKGCTALGSRGAPTGWLHGPRLQAATAVFETCLGMGTLTFC